jgi:DNA-binding NarL/FixJ family response regulator
MHEHHAPDAPAPLRVILVDDDALVRQVVRGVLQRDGIVVIAEAGSAREAIELSVYYQPDVVLMDALMPGMDGVAAMRQILAARPAAKVLMLSSSADDELAVLCLRLGACGYLTKSLNVESLPRAIRAARDGEAIVFVLSQEDLLGQRGAPGAMLANALLSGMRTLAAEGHRANAIAVGPDADPEDLQHWIGELEAGRGVAGELVRVHAAHVGKIQV